MLVGGNKADTQALMLTSLWQGEPETVQLGELEAACSESGSVAHSHTCEPPTREQHLTILQ